MTVHTIVMSDLFPANTLTQIPESLKEQLAIGGRMVIPVGQNVGMQRLTLITRQDEDQFVTEDLGPVRFVPLVGAEGWDGQKEAFEAAVVAPEPAAKVDPVARYDCENAKHICAIMELTAHPGIVIQDKRAWRC